MATHIELSWNGLNIVWLRDKTGAGDTYIHLLQKSNIGIICLLYVWAWQNTEYRLQERDMLPDTEYVNLQRCNNHSSLICLILYFGLIGFSLS